MNAASVLSHLAATVVLLLTGLSGCESEEVRQHHLYNLKQCIDGSSRADVLESETTWVKKNDKDMAHSEVVAQVPDLISRQRSHDQRVAECMANEEKTTLEYQRAKHDDYGKVF